VKSRLYVQEIPNGKPRAISPSGSDHVWWGGVRALSLDGRDVVGIFRNQALLYPIDGGEEPRKVPGLAPGDRVLQWTADSRSLYVYNTVGSPGKIWLVDLETGQKHPWKEFPSALAGGNVVAVRITPDGRSYVYGEVTTTSVLYLAEGLR
jgi:hypothetical protein